MFVYMQMENKNIKIKNNAALIDFSNFVGYINL